MGHRRLERLTRWPGALTRRRRWTGIAIALAVPVPATLVLHAIRGDVSLPDVSLLYLLPVLLASAVGGVVAGVLASLEGFVLFNWFSNPPLRTLVNPRDVLALAVFLAVGVAVSLEVDLAESRTVDARRVRSHAAALARATNVLLEDPDPLPALVEEVRRTFLVEGVTVLRSHGRQWEVEVAGGAHPPSSPEEASLCLPVREGRVLTLSASELSADDMEALRSFVAQIAVALATHELRHRAAESTALAKANEIRTALLAAVSHDLRTPLASIKAAATTFLPEDVPWDPPTVRALLETIDAEADRLHALVDNLLDMSRLSTGALAVQLRPVGFDEAVAAAVNSLPKDDHRVHLDVLDMLPPVVADLPLLERAIANLLSNALAASGPDSPVRVIAGRLPGIWSELRIIDRGPGIAPSDRERIFLPFQRLGDRSAGAGIGLGLAVAKGFVEAMGGELSVEDTPGGGATMALRLRTATTRPMEVVDARASGGRSQHVQCQRTPTAGEAHATDMPVVPAATSDGRAR